MQMTTDARLWLDATVRRILARHPLGDAERAGITYELMSHLHAAGEARASAEGRTEVSRGDLEAALAEAGGEGGLAQAFVQPLAKPIESAPLGRRFVALLVDGFLVLMGLTAIHTAVEVSLHLVAGVIPGGGPSPDAEPNWFLPWGFHDPTIAPIFQAVYTVLSAALVLGYFTWFEANEGRTLGKRAMELRVVRPDGTRIGYREAVIRNLSKLFPPLFFIDVLVGLIAFAGKGQRLSDKIAETIVVKA